MAELLGVAASAVSLVAFAGQLLKSAIVLHSFFKDIQDAPTHVQRLSDELDAIISILTKVKSSSRDDDPDLERVLGLIQSTIENISKTVISLPLSPAESKTRRTWNNVKAVFKNSEMSTLLNELERCKSMLLQVTQAQHSEALEGLKRSMTSFSLDQSNQTVSIRKTVSDTQTAVESIQSVVRTTQNVIGTTSVMVQHLANDTVSIRGTTQRIANDLIQRQPILLAAIGHDIKHAIAQELQQFSKEIQASNAARTGGPSAEMPNARNSERALVSNGQHIPLVSQQSKWKRDFSTLTISFSSRSTIFGQLRTKTLRGFYSKSDPETQVHEQHKEETVTQVEFFPATWLTSRAFILTYNAIKYFGTGQSSPTPVFGLRTVNVIPIDSEIIQAVRRVDIHTVRNLFETGRATPFDVEPRGWNLLQYAVVSCVFEKDKFGENRKQLANFNLLIDLLLGFGLNPGESYPGFMNTPLAAFISNWSGIARCRGISDGVHDELASVFAKLAENDKTDFSSTEPMIMLVCTDGDYLAANRSSLYGVHVNLRTIEFLMRQKYWPIVWGLKQPLAAASLELGTFRYGDNPPDGRFVCRDPNFSCIYSFVFFWLTATCEEVCTYLDAKTRFVHLLLSNARINDENFLLRYHLLEAVYSVLKSADDILTLLKAEQNQPQLGDSEAGENSDQNRGIWPFHGPGKIFAVEKYVYNCTAFFMHYFIVDEWVETSGVRYEMAHRAFDYGRNHEILRAFRCAWTTIDERMFGVPVCSQTTAQEIGRHDFEHNDEEEVRTTSNLDSDSETSEPSIYHDIEHDSDADTGPNEEERNTSTVDSDSETSEPSGCDDGEYDPDADTTPNEEERRSTSTVESDSGSETFEPPGMRSYRGSRIVNIYEDVRRYRFLASATCPEYSHKPCLIRERSWKYDHEIDYQYWFRRYDQIRGVEPYVDPDKGEKKGIISSVLSSTRDVLSFIV